MAKKRKARRLIIVAVVTVVCLCVGLVYSASKIDLDELAVGGEDRSTRTPRPTSRPRPTSTPRLTSTAQPSPTSETVMYFCGIDHCKNSGEYGKLIFSTGINVWNGPDPNRGGVHHQASHHDRVVILETKRVSSYSGGLWYRLKGGGWTNDLWLTDVPCTPQNLKELALDDC